MLYSQKHISLNLNQHENHLGMFLNISMLVLSQSIQSGMLFRITDYRLKKMFWDYLDIVPHKFLLIRHKMTYKQEDSINTQACNIVCLCSPNKDFSILEHIYYQLYQ